MKSWIDIDKSPTWVYVILECTCEYPDDQKPTRTNVLFKIVRDENEYLFELVHVISGYFNSIGFTIPITGLCPFDSRILRFYSESFEIIEYFDTFEDVSNKYPEYLIWGKNG